MLGRPFQVVWREEDTPEALKEAYQKERDPDVRTRLHSLWLLRCGWTLDWVAEAMGTHYRSVQRWAAWYRKGGLPEVRERKRGGRGRQPLLGPEEEIQVSDAMATGQFRTAWEIRDWIMQQYGANYTLGGTYSLLRRLKYASKAPQPVYAKTNRHRRRSRRGCPPSLGGTGLRLPFSNFPLVV